MKPITGWADWQRSTVHTHYVCLCSCVVKCARAHKHTCMLSNRNLRKQWLEQQLEHKSKKTALFCCASPEKGKRGKKTHYHHFSRQKFQGSFPPPGVCIALNKSDVLLGDLGRTTTPLWPPKISSETRGKLVRISQAVNSNQGPYINTQVETEQSLFK